MPLASLISSMIVFCLRLPHRLPSLPLSTWPYDWPLVTSNVLFTCGAVLISCIPPTTSVVRSFRELFFLAVAGGLRQPAGFVYMRASGIARLDDMPFLYVHEATCSLLQDNRLFESFQVSSRCTLYSTKQCR